VLDDLENDWDISSKCKSVSCCKLIDFPEVQAAFPNFYHHLLGECPGLGTPHTNGFAYCEDCQVCAGFGTTHVDGLPYCWKCYQADHTNCKGWGNCHFPLNFCGSCGWETGECDVVEWPDFCDHCGAYPEKPEPPEVPPEQMAFDYEETPWESYFALKRYREPNGNRRLNQLILDALSDIRADEKASKDSVAVFLPDNIEILDPYIDCRPYDSARCGGCDACLLMQAEHSGFQVEALC